MRIGIDARFYGSLGKGLGRYTEKLIAHLERLDTENEYFIFLRRENFDAFTPTNPRFQKILADYSWYGWQEQILFPRLLSRFKLDLMHFAHFNVPLFYRRPFVVTIHDLILLHFPTIKASELPPFLYWIKYWLYRGVIAHALRNATSVLTVSQFTREDILKHYPVVHGKIFLTYEAADAFCSWMPEKEGNVFLSEKGLFDEEKKMARPYLLYVGNAYPHKNLELLLDAATHFRETLFVLVGREDYFYGELKEKVKSRKLTNVFFVGLVRDGELGLLYRHARAYLFPSLYEGFGLPALEAMTYGLPVIAARRGSLPEIVGEAGILFDPKKKNEFLEAITSLLESESQHTILRALGFARIEKFHWEDMARDTLAIYTKKMHS